ncbi:hypothetical protein BC940DRAFT_306869 [Gongronella butleri]|nr:hypothetical protein BC940DRAFT_306869 [Gongronella butleri]
MAQGRRKKSQLSKDKFIDLAQAALEEADLEEDRRSVLGDVVEALINTTGAPLVAEVISQQLTSQDVIEKSAEQHYTNQRQTRSRSLSAASSLADLSSDDDEIGIIDPYKEHDDSPVTLPPAMASPWYSSPYVLAEYLWRVFRCLLLASIVALIYQFFLHHPHYFTFLLAPKA